MTQRIPGTIQENHEALGGVNEASETIISGFDSHLNTGKF